MTFWTRLEERIKQLFAWLRHSGLSWLACAMLFLTDQGTIAQVWRRRQASGSEWVGYAVAFGLDIAAALGLDRMAHARKRSHKLAALGVFAVAIGLPCFFGTRYYRDNAPTDPPALSIAMGSVAPVLAALVAWLRGMGVAFEERERLDLERQEREEERAAQRAAALELDKYRVDQEQTTARLAQVEETKRARIQVKLAKAQAEAAEGERVAQLMATTAQEGERQAQLVATLGNFEAELGTLRAALGNPEATQAQLAVRLGISRRTVGNHLRKLEQAGVINRNGKGIELSESARMTGLIIKSREGE